MKIGSIGIIGGTGGLGARFARFFEENFPGVEVVVSGRETEITNKNIVQKCDLVIFAVPIDQTLEVMTQLVPASREDQIWMDFTSIKTQPVKSMLASKAQVCGAHPLFGPMPHIEGQTFIYCPERIEASSLESVLEFFQAFDLVELSPKEHDDLMGIVQCASHFSDMVMAEAIKNSGFDFSKVWQVSSPSYRLKLEVMGRMFAQNPNLYADIAIQNLSGSGATESFIKAAQDLGTKVKAGNRDFMINNFVQSRKFLTPQFCAQAYENSQNFLAAYSVDLEAKKVSSLEKKGDLAVFGEPHSHTDEVAESLFDGESKIYFKNIFRLFEALQNGQVQKGIVPYENSYEGSVFEVIDELFDHRDIAITQITSRPISQNLMMVEGGKREYIETIFSHPQALAQSKQFLRAHCPRAELNQMASTSTAARKVSQAQNKTWAAIGSQTLAQDLGLTIVASDISPEDNETRFVVIEKNPPITKTQNTAFVFWFNKDRSGNLAEVLQYFSVAGINLTKLDSRRAEEAYGGFVFFVDAEVSWDQFKNIEEDLASMVAGMRVLGGY